MTGPRGHHPDLLHAGHCRAVGTDGDGPGYLETLETILRLSCRESIDKGLSEHNFDVWVYVSTSAGGIAALAGYPSVSVPAGYTVEGKPVGITFSGTPTANRR